MHRLLKKIITFVTAAALFGQAATLTAFAKPDWPADTGIMANFGIIVDMDSKTVLFGQKIHVPSPPASITKLLTALVVVENCEMDEIVTFSYDAIYNVESGSTNTLEFEEGDRVSVEDCLYAMLLISSNPAANALAEHAAGSREAFADMMNEKLKELGCAESRFANPSGLNDDNQYVSAYDMALIAMAAFQNEKVLEISSSKSHSMPATQKRPDGTTIRMEHKLLMASDPGSQFYLEGAVAGKTGFTSIAGNTLVTYARRDGRNILSIILKGTQPQYYMDAKNIMNFGFSSFRNMPVKGSETFLSENQQLEANGNTYPVSELSLDEDAVITLPAAAEFSDAERTLVTDLPDGHPEDAAAMLQYTYNGREIGRAYIHAESLKAAPAASDDTSGSQAPQEPDRADGGSESTPEGESAGGDEPSPSDTYNGREIGRAYIHAESLKAAQSTPEEESAGGDEPSPSGRDGAGINWMIALIVLAVLGLTGGGFAFFQYRQRKEREALARRKERRRQRLLESGVSEEEFAALLQKRMKNNAADTSKTEKE